MPSIEKSRVLILATDGFEQSELFEPRAKLIEAGAAVTLDITLDQVDIKQYDGLLLPGGVANPDSLRTDDKAVEIVRNFTLSGKPVAAICHGPWLLVEADVVDGRTVTSWPSVRTDLANAGASVVDREVVVDGNLITSRKPEDIPAFVDAFRTALADVATADA